MRGPPDSTDGRLNLSMFDIDTPSFYTRQPAQ
jgi:hypothetical protein